MEMSNITNNSSDLQVEVLLFCHHTGPFGYLLGLFQYVPLALFFGIYFWSIVNKDLFFIYLAITLKMNWILGLLLKWIVLFVNRHVIYNIYSGINLSFNSTNQQSTLIIRCDNFVPSFIHPFLVLLFPNISSSYLVEYADSFPHLDTMQTGTYIGYVMCFYVLWMYPISWIYLIGLLSLTFIPWSFVSTHSVSLMNISLSFYIGIVIGVFGLWLGYKVYKSGYGCMFYFFGRPKCCKCFSCCFYGEHNDCICCKCFNKERNDDIEWKKSSINLNNKNELKNNKYSAIDNRIYSPFFEYKLNLNNIQTS